MQSLTAALLEDAAIRRVAASVDGAGPAVISGLSPIHRAHLLAAIHGGSKRPVLLLVSGEMEARRAISDLGALTGGAPVHITPRDFFFRDLEGVSREYEQKRLHALYKTQHGATVFVTTPAALMQRAAPPDVMRAAALTLSHGEKHDIDALCGALTKAGYTRAEQVEGFGQFAKRGGILDFYSPAHDEPVRCEFWGDEIDSLNFFDASSQRREDACERAVILPATETLPEFASPHGSSDSEGGPYASGGVDGLIAALKGLEKRGGAIREKIAADIARLRDRRSFPAADKYLELIYPFASALDYLPADAVVMLSEPGRVREAAERYEKQLAEETLPLLESGALDASLNRFCLGAEDFFSALERFDVVMADAFTVSRYPLMPKMLESAVTKQLPSYGGSLETAAGDAAHYGTQNYRVVVTVSSKSRADALAEFLRERGVRAALDYDLEKLPEPGACSVAVGALSAGMEYPGIKLAVMTEGQFNAEIPARRLKSWKKSNRERVQSYTDLTPGSLVVHEQHGIGRYAGLFTMTVDGAPRDYIKIVYRDNDSLYIPATQLDLVSKYIGGGEETPVRLSKMGGGDWVKAKSRASASARDMARELIALYAERQRLRGHAFAPDTVWQREFEDNFGYDETDDQLRCIGEIKGDMERSVPMDRLLCGDVGYGKTEVALRAVMKCVLDGHQAAILVPTTVLANQHFITASKRFAGYPVNIETLSRFKSHAEIKKSLRNIEGGRTDLVIGTHRLLSADVKFRKLGLLVVDEEQRFGVSHKEKLKDLARRVDVLTLSATPIPRTLNMALSGIRDMSLIEEPPSGRQPVQTYVMEHDWGVLTDAMSRELARGGQVYYLHNRIDNIDRVAARISEMMEGAASSGSPAEHGSVGVRVAVAHGRMEEDALSDVMERVSGGEVQILVCTTIIETGIDIPNVNTLIIEDADHMGLAQLHQIRGRVGRSPRRAFAYLTFRRGKVLTEVAEKRLSAIREFAEFNSGFKIAMRDLEIRGAGNLLGAEQSGHMMKVGYDMYLKLLEDAVIEERGEKTKPRTLCSAELAVAAQLPEKYVPSGEQRVDLYRRIARVESEESADEMVAELIDRYGDPPPEAVNLVRIARLRHLASGCGISEIAQKGNSLRLKLDNFDMGIVSALYATDAFKGRLKVEAGSTPAVSLRLGGNSLDEAERLVAAWTKVAAPSNGK